MNSSLDFSIKNASVFSMDIDQMDFWDLDSTDGSMELQIEMSLSASFNDTLHTDILQNKYYQDASSHVRLYGLGKLFNEHILSWRGEHGDDDDILNSLRRSIFVRFTYKYTEKATTYTGYAVREVYYSTRTVGLSPEEMGGYLPILNRKKKTFIDLNEPFYLLDVQEQRYLSVGIASVVDGAAKYDEIDLDEDERNYSFKYYDLSPKTLLQLISNKYGSVDRLLFYDVILKQEDGTVLDKCRYTIDTRHFERQEFLYMNMLGAFESVVLTGQQTYEPDRSAEYGYCGDEYKALDLQVNDIYEKNSGYTNKIVIGQLRDMLESPSVYVYDAYGFRPITIIDSSFSINKPTNESYNVSIKYRYASEKDDLNENFMPWQKNNVFTHPPFDRSFS